MIGGRCVDVDATRRSLTQHGATLDVRVGTLAYPNHGGCSIQASETGPLSVGMPEYLAGVHRKSELTR